MKLIYGEQLNSSQEKIVCDISYNCGITYDTARLLYYRNHDTVEKAKAFLSPNKSKLLNPFDFSTMQQAVDRIKLAKDLNQKVVVFGDYDADGVCALSVLNSCLKEFGIEAELFIPEREEGYGLNLEKIAESERQKHIDLLITVDCGISDYEKIEILKENGTDVIVTDHHEPPLTLPDCLIINPKVKELGYQFEGLCGAGVAYKLGYALIGEKANNYLDFVALATIADNMDLVGENRSIVIEGLKIFNNNVRLPFKYLITDNNRKINAQTLAYSIAPRVNAGGRMGDALSALKLFISKDEKEIFDLAVKLNTYNTARQVECDNIYREAKEKIKNEKLYQNPVILVADEKWKTGFIGIVASKLVEDYSRPVIVFADGVDTFKGSARSIDGINILNVINDCSDLLVGFGGHSQAAGVTVEKCNLRALQQKMSVLVNEKYGSFEKENKVYVDWKIDKPIDSKFVQELEMLEPFGIGNRKPLFSVDVNRVDLKPLREGSPHYNFNTEFIEILDFNGEKDVSELALPIDKTIVFELNRSVFKGKESVKGYLKTVVSNYGDFSNLSLEIFRNELLKGKNQQKKDITYVNYCDNLVKDGYGILYVLSDPKNANKYKGLEKLPKTLFDAHTFNGKNGLVVSLSTAPSGYSKIVYLDNPMFVLDTDIETIVVKDVSGKNFFENVSTDRQYFERVFNILNDVINQEYFDVKMRYENMDSIENPYQFIFSSEVFFELGFFEIKNGQIKRNYNEKSLLTNSKIYANILEKKVNC